MEATDIKARTQTGLTRRRLLVSSAGVAAGGLLAACAPTASPTGASPTPALATVAATPTLRAPATVKLWYIAQGAAFEPVIKAAIKDFEESQTSIKVQLDVQPTVDMRNKIRPIFTSGGPGPDILYEGAVQTLTYAEMPFGFIDLTDRVKAAGLRDKTPAGAWFPLEKEGKSFGMPLNAFPFFMGYNKDLYEAAGLKGVPQTWDEQLEYMRKIWDQQKDKWGFITFTNRFISWLFETMMYDAGIGYVEGSEDWKSFDMTKPITFNGPEGVQILERIRSMAETAPGGLRGNFGIGSAQAITAFSRGNLGHYHGHSIHFSQIQSQNPNLVGGKNFDVYVLPKGPKRQGAQFSTSVLGITKGSQDPDAAFEVMKFISDKWEGALSASIGTVPVRQDATVPADAPKWLMDAGSKALAGDAFPSAFFPQLDSVREPLGKQVEAFFLGQKSAKQALDDAATEFANVLKR